MGERVEAAIDRMHGIAALLAQGQDNVRQAPQAWIEQAVDECVGALNFFDNGINQLIKEHGITDAFQNSSSLSDRFLHTL